MKRIVVLVPGILSNPFAADRWHNSGGDILRGAGMSCAAHAYEQGFIRNPKTQTWVAAELAQRIRRWLKMGFAVDCVAHSNGTAIACRALREPGVRIRKLLFLWPAAWESFEDNGLNDALMHSHVREFHCWCSKKDRIVRWGGTITDPFGLLNRIGLGYGKMSYTGPVDVHPSFAAAVEKNTRWRNDWGHCTFQREPHLTEFFSKEVIACLNLMTQ